jgi:hypothetical protein
VLSTAVMVVRSAPIQVSVLCPFFTALRPSFSFPHRLWRRDAAAGRLMVVSRERVWKSVDEGIDGILGWRFQSAERG